jgi:hypothetical protein
MPQSPALPIGPNRRAKAPCGVMAERFSVFLSDFPLWEKDSELC